MGTLGALGGYFRCAQHPLSLTAIRQKWVLPELYTRGLLAIVGPVDSVNLWKTSFWKGYMDCASAQALSTGSLAFLSAAPLKTANPQPLVSKIWAFSLI